MKPPSRLRIKPTRFVSKKTDNTGTKRKPKIAFTGWSRTEQQILLRCLNSQSKKTAGIHGAIDLEALHAKLPKRSTEEIQSQLECLMMRVLRSVVIQVKSQRSEQKVAMKPIQQWAELAHDMAGALEEPITSAFAQMLVISATEPGSLKNSDPPREGYISKPQSSNLKTIPARPIPTPVSVTPPAHPRALNSPTGAISKYGGNTSSIPSTHQSNHPTVTVSPVAGDVSTRQLPLAASGSSASSGPAAAGARPTHQHTSAGPRRSKHADGNTPRYTGLGCIVDLEKIYRFLSTIHIQSECFKLTPMESAVVLDLLMSLPEELPLLDCARLQHHLLEVHKRFSAPVPKAAQGRICTGKSTSLNEEGTKAEDQGRPVGHRGGNDEGETPVTTPPHQAVRDAAVAPLETLPKSPVDGEQDVSIRGMPDGQGSDGAESSLTNQDAASTAASGNLVAGCSDFSAEDGAALAPGSTQERVGSETFTPLQASGHDQGQPLLPNDTSVKSGKAKQRKADWKKAGLCPLNPFVVPLKLLARRTVQPVEEVASQ
ncbi:snRNA-activating protein complex subunit 2 [Esox lucius]|uniref:snRNA-activating protein complex subunit 2 n=1 Tax=Esox lucius TaxID=8010 RepID=A0A3P8ZUS0_ESOLU|nr:snRNA-activating protein complex subunit 2 [Esox lucius]XP_019898666.1 snRNA-activating protein complex subunit 2 [Esox lucius]XP_019898667.1 snRNA-activating protein complex subunit 2 [Esox lucius]